MKKLFSFHCLCDFILYFLHCAAVHCRKTPNSTLMTMKGIKELKKTREMVSLLEHIPCYNTWDSFFLFIQMGNTFFYTTYNV